MAGMVTLLVPRELTCRIGALWTVTKLGKCHYCIFLAVHLMPAVAELKNKHPPLDVLRVGCLHEVVLVTLAEGEVGVQEVAEAQEVAVEVGEVEGV